MTSGELIVSWTGLSWSGLWAWASLCATVALAVSLALFAFGAHPRRRESGTWELTLPGLLWNMVITSLVTGAMFSYLASANGPR